LIIEETDQFQIYKSFMVDRNRYLDSIKKKYHLILQSKSIDLTGTFRGSENFIIIQSPPRIVYTWMMLPRIIF